MSVPEQGRDQGILDAVVREYIHTARPISSEQVRELGFGDQSPATLRSRLAVLEENGFLIKPHTSGGRIPTEKAYRYFVQCLERRYREVNEDIQLLRKHRAEELLSNFSETLHLVTGVTSETETLQTQGFDQLFSEPEFASQEFVVQFGKLFAELPNIVMRERRKRQLDHNHVLMGKSELLPGTQDLSLIISVLEDGNVFFAIGPTRMDYDQAFKLLNDNS